jgi:thiamine biosynthesis lipoprotein
MGAALAAGGGCPSSTPAPPPPPSPAPTSLVLQGDAAGVPWQATLAPVHGAMAARARAETPVIAGALAERARQLSVDTADSELSLYNRAPYVPPKTAPRRAGAPIAPARGVLSQGTLLIVDRALDIAAATDGAYDPTRRPLLDLWTTTRALGQPAPAAGDLDAARARTGHRLLTVDDDGRLKSQRADVVVDVTPLLAAVQADAAADALAEHGFGDVLVRVGDAVVARGQGPTGPWTTTVGPLTVVLDGRAAPRTLVSATRSAARPALDPATDAPADHDVQTCSVVAADAVVAAALADACLGLGEPRTRALVGRLEGVEVAFVHAAAAPTTSTTGTTSTTTSTPPSTSTTTSTTGFPLAAPSSAPPPG